jgi:hypothetical protein
MASDSENILITMEDIISSIKSLESGDLFKLLKAITNEAEKKSKTNKKIITKSTSTKKSGSMPKGSVPPQLKKPRAWVDFTLKHALENGWESFTAKLRTKDKETGEKMDEEIEMPCSILYDGAYVYKGSVTEKYPKGKQLIHKDAMSLSKQRKESGHISYAEFEAQYVDETTYNDKSDTESTVSSASKKIVIKKTVAEKEAEADAKRIAKEAEKAAAKAAKEAEKAATKAAKEAAKEAAKVAKVAEKEAKKTEKKSVVKAPIPAVSTSEDEVNKTTITDTAPQVPKKKPSMKEAKVEEIPNDGMVHPWMYKGKKYLRNADGETWTVGTDGGVGEWAGMYNVKENNLDTSAPEPVLDDEE